MPDGRFQRFLETLSPLRPNLEGGSTASDPKKRETPRESNRDTAE